jgi:brefeldin A-inhibited guanine nucleotide-exchange protein
VCPPDLLNDKTRKDLFVKEAEYILESVEERLRGDQSNAGIFVTATRVEHLRQMLRVSWSTALAALSHYLNSYDDAPTVQACLESFRGLIHIACTFGMELERDALAQSLTRFTGLDTAADLKTKNVETIKVLLSIAHRDGNGLMSSWIHVLRCISQLEKAQIITSLRGGLGAGGGGGGGAGGAGAGGNGADAGAGLGSAASQPIVLAVDKVFTGSVHLNGDAIEEFVRHLCAVSTEELQVAAGSRTFCLQKIVEICYYNMGRVRLEWSRMWAIIGEHFNRVGCLANHDVAMFAIDALRQLSIKFLEKGELANFSFQKDFLKPFEYIVNHNKSMAIRDMVVRCLSQMVLAKAKNIRSGWKNIFYVFSLAASDENEDIVLLAFEQTSFILERHFEAIADSFMNAVNCLVEFASNPHFTDTAMEALRLVEMCANRVADAPPGFFARNGDDDIIWLRGWFPVMIGLSRVIGRCKLDIRTRALTVLFDILKTHGGSFRIAWWKDMFRIVFRIYDDLKQPEQQAEVRVSSYLSVFVLSLCFCVRASLSVSVSDCLCLSVSVSLSLSVSLPHCLCASFDLSPSLSVSLSVSVSVSVSSLMSVMHRKPSG